jgi:hypothetical protein
VQLEARLASLAKINERGSAVQEEVAKLRRERLELQKQLELISKLIRTVREVGEPPVENDAGSENSAIITSISAPNRAAAAAALAASAVAPMVRDEFLQTVRVLPTPAIDR